MQKNLPPNDTEQAQFTQHQLLDMPQDTIRYLALGDSYTIGESVSPNDRWPVLLAEALSEKPELLVPSPQIIAQTGWTTANLSNGMDNAGVDEEEYDLVSLLIGVNNQYQGLDVEQYALEFEDLLLRAIGLTGDSAKVFVVSIPNYGYTPFGVSNQETITEELNLFNATCQSISEYYGVKFYNITPISEQWPDVPDLVAADGLHPSGYQYGLWVESFLDDVYDQVK